MRSLRASKSSRTMPRRDHQRPPPARVRPLSGNLRPGFRGEPMATADPASLGGAFSPQCFGGDWPADRWRARQLLAAAWLGARSVEGVTRRKAKSAGLISMMERRNDTQRWYVGNATRSCRVVTSKCLLRGLAPRPLQHQSWSNRGVVSRARWPGRRHGGSRCLRAKNRESRTRQRTRSPARA